MGLKNQPFIAQNSDAQFSIMEVFKAAAEHFANLENIGPLIRYKSFNLEFDEPSPDIATFILNLMLYGERGIYRGKDLQEFIKIFVKNEQNGQNDLVTVLRNRGYKLTEIRVCSTTLITIETAPMTPLGQLAPRRP